MKWIIQLLIMAVFFNFIGEHALQYKYRMVCTVQAHVCTSMWMLMIATYGHNMICLAPFHFVIYYSPGAVAHFRAEAEKKEIRTKTNS